MQGLTTLALITTLLANAALADDASSQTELLQRLEESNAATATSLQRNLDSLLDARIRAAVEAVATAELPVVSREFGTEPDLEVGSRRLIAAR